MRLTWKLGNFEFSLLDIILFLTCICFLFARLLSPGLAQFVSDEPKLAIQWDILREQGKITFVGLSGSNLATPYGALASWLYGFVKLFSHHPKYFALMQSSISVASILLVVAMVKRYTTGRLWLYFFAAIACSPYIFFYNRHPWDNTFIIPFTGFLIVAYLQLSQALSSGERGKVIFWSIGTGIACGLLVNIHLMAMILVLALVLALLLQQVYARKGLSELLMPIGIGLISFVVIILPYALEAMEVAKTLQTPTTRGDRTLFGDGRQLYWSFIKSNVHLSTFGVRNFWGPLAWSQFSEFVGDAFTFLYRKDIQGWPVKVAAFVFIFFATFRFFKRSEKFKFYPLDFLMLTAFYGIVAAFWVLNIPVQPHYYHVVWWVGAYAFARAFMLIELKVLRVTLQAIFIFVCFVNITYIANTMRFVHVNDGYRGINFGPSIYEQWDATTRLCELIRKMPDKKKYVVDLGKVEMFGEPLIHNMRHKDECLGINTLFVRNWADGVDIRARHPVAPDTSAKLEFYRTDLP